MAKVLVDPHEKFVLPWSVAIFVAVVFGLGLRAMPPWFELWGSPSIALMLILTIFRVAVLRPGRWRDAWGWQFPLMFLVGTTFLEAGDGVTPPLANGLAALLVGSSAVATVVAWISSSKRSPSPH